MRIVCEKFRDYYDAVQAMGQDLTMVYVRNPKLLSEKKGDKIPGFPHCNSGKLSRYNLKNRFITSLDLSVSDYIVGFCGKIYGVLELQQHNGRRSINDRNPRKFCFGQQEVDDFIKANFKEEQISCYQAKRWTPRSNWFPTDRRSEFVKFWDGVEKAKTKYENLFLEHSCPIFVANLDEVTITYNACLKDLEFYRVFDPYMAFQEISMYLGNMAQPQKPIPKISDEILAEAKGFDKFSFRKDKKSD